MFKSSTEQKSLLGAASIFQPFHLVLQTMRCGIVSLHTAAASAELNGSPRMIIAVDQQSFIMMVSATVEIYHLLASGENDHLAISSRR